MLVSTARRLNALSQAYSRPLTILGWLCFALVCADYARFIELPSFVTVPFWAGVILNVLRWGVWEGMLKARVEAALNEQNETTAA